jgi:hypothetical protein
MQNDVTDILDKENWDVIIIKLTAYAIWQCNVNYRDLPSTIEPEDLVMDAIDKVYSGVRKWDAQKDPDLLNFLKSVVQSHLDNEIRTGRHAQEFEELQESSAAVTEDIDSELYYQQMDEKIIETMKGDPEVCLVYKGFKDGLKPGEISEEYGVSIDLVRNAQKRLRTIVLKIIPSRVRVKKMINEN